MRIKDLFLFVTFFACRACALVSYPDGPRRMGLQTLEMPLDGTGILTVQPADEIYAVNALKRTTLDALKYHHMILIQTFKDQSSQLEQPPIHNLTPCMFGDDKLCAEYYSLFIERVVEYTSLSLKRIQSIQDAVKKAEDVARKLLVENPLLGVDPHIQSLLARNMKDIQACGLNE